MCSATFAEEAFDSPWFIAVLAVGAVFSKYFLMIVLVVSIIMIKFCCKFSTENNKEHNKRLKTSLDPPKPRKKKRQNSFDEDVRSAERMIKK